MNQSKVPSNPKLLLVDDDRHLLESMSAWLASKGYEVSAVSSCTAARNALDGNPFDVAVVDLRLADGDGFGTLYNGLCRQLSS